jgi:hypothetical protein
MLWRRISSRPVSHREVPQMTLPFYEKTDGDGIRQNF